VVLFVASDLHRRLHFSEFLADAGFEVLTASSAELALDVIRMRRPRIVISELVVPGAHGIEFPARVRAAVAGNGAQPFLIGLLPEIFYGSNDVVQGLGFDEVLHANVPAVMLSRMVLEVDRRL
jgi:DNA-binding response OmpR family regulator